MVKHYGEEQIKKQLIINNEKEQEAFDEMESIIKSGIAIPIFYNFKYIGDGTKIIGYGSNVKTIYVKVNEDSKVDAKKCLSEGILKITSTLYPHFILEDNNADIEDACQ